MTLSTNQPRDVSYPTYYVNLRCAIPLLPWDIRAKSKAWQAGVEYRGA